MADWLKNAITVHGGGYVDRDRQAFVRRKGKKENNTSGPKQPTSANNEMNNADGSSTSPLPYEQDPVQMLGLGIRDGGSQTHEPTTAQGRGTGLGMTGSLEGDLSASGSAYGSGAVGRARFGGGMAFGRRGSGFGRVQYGGGDGSPYGPAGYDPYGGPQPRGRYW
ncbi:hypothetical protein LTR56_017284 [Elasticomyces elasticus]|nr:hypothetical protein LTR56_017284 [Elasticomyces elasticus]KAK3639416.1 hypothetical protein LTR22_017450 [Elasticomyces elasticus]KAK4924601.1 hypothetical protein LTR49_008284 [Elasticomyces elasticus]KAK5763051.1 hypothetical protein LTS12_006835 [Elasticomyces elasticus]